MSELQVVLSPPSNRPPKQIASGYEDDDIRSLGDSIAALDKQESKELLAYLRLKLGISKD